MQRKGVRGQTRVVERVEVDLRQREQAAVAELREVVDSLEKAAIAIRAAEILTSDPDDWKKLEGESLLLLPRLEIRNSTRSVQV